MDIFFIVRSLTEGVLVASTLVLTRFFNFHGRHHRMMMFFISLFVTVLIIYVCHLFEFCRRPFIVGCLIIVVYLWLLIYKFYKSHNWFPMKLVFEFYQKNQWSHLKLFSNCSWTKLAFLFWKITLLILKNEPSYFEKSLLILKQIALLFWKISVLILKQLASSFWNI